VPTIPSTTVQGMVGTLRFAHPTPPQFTSNRIGSFFGPLTK
jgi:hypothetical protein